MKAKPGYNFNDVSVQCYKCPYTHIKFNQNGRFLSLPQYEKVFNLEYSHSIFKYCSYSKVSANFLSGQNGNDKQTIGNCIGGK